MNIPKEIKEKIKEEFKGKNKALHPKLASVVENMKIKDAIRGAEIALQEMPVTTNTVGIDNFSEWLNLNPEVELHQYRTIIGLIIKYKDSLFFNTPTT